MIINIDLLKKRVKKVRGEKERKSLTFTVI